MCVKRTGQVFLQLLHSRCVQISSSPFKITFTFHIRKKVSISIRTQHRAIGDGGNQAPSFFVVVNGQAEIKLSFLFSMPRSRQVLSNEYISYHFYRLCWCYQVLKNIIIITIINSNNSILSNLQSPSERRNNLDLM